MPFLDNLEWLFFHKIMVADAAAPYFHHFFNFSDSHPPPPSRELIKIYSLPFKTTGEGGGSKLWLGSLRVVFQKLLKGAQFQAIIVVLSSISTK